MIKVLIVEDSPVSREFMRYILNSDPDLQVIGTAKDGKKALEFVEHKKPDVITMDINMPRMNGFEATRRIMSTTPVPIVIVTGSWNPKEVSTSFRALEAGALACIGKPPGMGHPEHEAITKELITTVKLMSEVKVVRRWFKPRETVKTPPKPREIRPGELRDIKIIAIGASSGGPIVLQKILSKLPNDLTVPVLIVQHISKGFVQGLVDWLSETTQLPIHIASAGETPLPGHIYIAPDDFQMGINGKNHIALNKDISQNKICPSVSHLFCSVAEVYGRNAAGVLLTGMGKDGAAELKLMSERGAVTIAQDEESSTVHGMPGEAIKLGAAKHILNPDEIAITLTTLVNRK